MSRFKNGPSTASRTPQCADDDLLLIKRVVDMAGDFAKVDASKADNIGVRVRCTSSRENAEDLQCLFELGREDLCVDSVLDPPSFLAPDVFLCRAVTVKRTRRCFTAT